MYSSPSPVLAASDTGLVRQRNEDCCGATQDDRCLALADGMGGHPRGEEASQAAVRAVLRNWDPTAEVVPWLQRAFHRAQSAVAALADPRSGPRQPGSTLVVAVSAHPRVVVGHLGDSRAWLCEGGRLRQLTQDHSIHGALLRHLGEGGAGDPELTFVTPVPGSILLLSSDGLHGVVKREKIERILTRGRNRAEMLAQLRAAAVEKGAPDNVTLMLARV